MPVGLTQTRLWKEILWRHGPSGKDKSIRFLEMSFCYAQEMFPENRSLSLAFMKEIPKELKIRSLWRYRLRKRKLLWNTTIKKKKNSKTPTTEIKMPSLGELKSNRGLWMMRSFLLFKRFFVIRNLSRNRLGMRS